MVCVACCLSADRWNADSIPRSVFPEVFDAALLTSSVPKVVSALAQTHGTYILSDMRDAAHSA
eukprot:3169057-Pleurochrysis_carterae.AAC.1